MPFVNLFHILRYEDVNGFAVVSTSVTRTGRNVWLENVE